jgi:hypothetical protein
VEGIELGTTSSFKTVDTGHANKDGSCEGTPLIYKGVTYTKAVKVSHYKVTIKKGTARKVIISGENAFPDGYTFSYNRGGCYSSMFGRRLWTVKQEHSPCGETKYDLLYGWANETRSSTSPLVVAVESANRNFALAVKHHAVLCGYQGYVTDDTKIIIIT